jgi:hypothetical protein
MDVNGDERLELRNVIVGLALLGDRDKEDRQSLSSPTTHNHHHHANFFAMAYSLLDPEGTGQVEREDLERVLFMVWPHLSRERVAEITAVPAKGGGVIQKEDFMAWLALPEATEALKEAFALVNPLA